MAAANSPESIGGFSSKIQLLVQLILVQWPNYNCYNFYVHT